MPQNLLANQLIIMKVTSWRIFCLFSRKDQVCGSRGIMEHSALHHKQKPFQILGRTRRAKPLKLSILTAVSLPNSLTLIWEVDDST